MESSAIKHVTDYDKRVMDLLESARQQPASERDSFLRFICKSEMDLYREVSDALAWEERMGGFLQKPMMNFVDLARPFHAGDVIADRFEILREIGEGGMGVVYEAFDRTRRQRIAIKAAKLGFQSLLSPELEGALKVRHPNICLVNEIHSAHIEQGQVDFLTMELLKGETLATHLAKHGKLASDKAIDIARQLCAGIAEAHRSNIIHRDLKSANVMLCPDDNGGTRVVITDFGLAGSATPEQADIAGTPVYMAPELFQGERTSKASDIYALGVILHELFVGERPLAQLQSPRPQSAPFAVTNKSGNPRWDRVIEHCLNPNPHLRPRTATEVIHALEKKFLPTNQLLIIAVVIALVLVIASQVPVIRDWLADHLWPPSSNVRLAILPLTAPLDETSNGIMDGVLQDVSDRIAKMRSDRRTIVVLTPREASSNRADTPERARTILHATHALQTSIQREGNEFVTHASVVDLATQVNVKELSGRYSTDTIGNMPSALSGAVSLALRLRDPVASDTLSPTAAARYDQGLYLLRRDDESYTQAIALLEDAARLDPKSTLPLAALIEAQIAKFKATKDASSVDAAKRTLAAAESINPDSVAVRLAAGMLAESTGSYEQAREDYQRVLELDPRNVNAYLRRANVDDALNNAERATDSYRKAIALAPDYYKPYHNFGVFYYYRGRYREAAEQFQKAIERAPGRVDEYINLAAALSDLGENEKAEQTLLASLRIHETASALNSLGAIRAFQKNDAEAVEYYRRSVKIDAGYYVYWLNLGDSARRLGLTSESVAAYNAAMKLAKAELAQNPRLGLPRAYAAYFAARLGQPDRAKDDIEESLKFSPGDSKVIRRAVLTFEVLGRRDDAFNVLNNAGPELLLELERHPDLNSLTNDARFRELLSHTTTRP